MLSACADTIYDANDLVSNNFVSLLQPPLASSSTIVWYTSLRIESARKRGTRNMDKEVFEKGLRIRRDVLGADFVDNAFATADDFNRPLQELVTQYCWGEIWGRTGLDKKTRSLLNLAMLSALNRPHEIKAHVRGALANRVTKHEIKEGLLQVAIYCGVPAAVDSFRIARETFKELGV